MKVFLAGTVQGSSAAANADQSYRHELTDVLHREFGSQIEVIDPTTWTADVLSRPEARETIEKLSQWDAPEPLRPTQLGGVLDEARHHFWEQARRVSECDLCIAYLPGEGVSMGTAMEMALAHEAGVPVIVVTANTSNLAILATADVVVASLSTAVSVAAERLTGDLNQTDDNPFVR